MELHLETRQEKYALRVSLNPTYRKIIPSVENNFSRLAMLTSENSRNKNKNQAREYKINSSGTYVQDRDSNTKHCWGKNTSGPRQKSKAQALAGSLLRKFPEKCGQGKLLESALSSLLGMVTECVRASGGESTEGVTFPGCVGARGASDVCRQTASATLI
jgi:hypothetical protein